MTPDFALIGCVVGRTTKGIHLDCPWIIRRSNVFIAGLGAVFFGFAVGWIAYRILRLRAGAPGLSDLITILGVIGGAAVIALFRSDGLFGWYSIGLVIGFFAYFGIGLMLYGEQELQPWRIENIHPTPRPDTQSNVHPDVRDAS